MIRSSSLIVHKNEIKDFKALEQRLTIRNPEYTQKSRFGRFFVGKDVPEFISFLEPLRGEKFKVPRCIVPNYSNNDILYNSNILIDKRSYGSNVDYKYLGGLRSYQQNFLRKIDLEKTTDCVWSVPCGHGKCHTKGTLIRLYSGSVIAVEDVKVGDLLMGPDGSPRKVLSLARGKEQCYNVVQTKGMVYGVNESHILSLIGRGEYKKDGIVNISVKDYLKKSQNWKNLHLGYRTSVKFNSKCLPIDPYFLGLWLGDGSSRHVSFTTDPKDSEIVKVYYEMAKKNGLVVRVSYNSPNSNFYYLSCGKKGKRNSLLSTFKQLDLIKNKHIPADYLNSSKKQRLQLLAGLIDTDGSYSNYCLEISQVRHELAYQIKTLCNSLGFFVSVSGSKYKRLVISGSIHEIPTRLPRKFIDKRTINKDPYVTSFKLESLGEQEYFGFTISGDHLYCLEDYTVTHNTVMSLYAIAERKVTTLVLVPTNYLARQWYRSAERFLGNCRVGVASSADKEINYENYDILIITFDLLGSRNLPSEFFSYWGQVILDEAHRVGAPTYHPVISRLNSYYRLALSATFRRADKMHTILSFHFGEVFTMPLQFDLAKLIFLDTGIEITALLSLVKMKKSEVNWKMFEAFCSLLDSYKIDYNIEDDIFECGEYDRVESILKKLFAEGKLAKTRYSIYLSYCKRLKGFALKANYSLLDSYVGKHSTRNFLLKQVIKAALKEGRCILFLSKRKEVLKEFHKYFQKLGYKSALVVSKTDKDFKAVTQQEEDYENFVVNEAQVIFGIMQLAQEGLDIERLDTLVLHQPIKDPEQAIGRIIRDYKFKKVPKVLYPYDKCRPYQGLIRAGMPIIRKNAVVLPPKKLYEIDDVVK